MTDVCLVLEGARRQKIRGVVYVVAAGGCYVREDVEYTDDPSLAGCEKCRAKVIRDNVAAMHRPPPTQEDLDRIEYYRAMRVTDDRRRAQNVRPEIPRPKPKDLPKAPSCRVCGTNRHMSPVYAYDSWGFTRSGTPKVPKPDRIVEVRPRRVHSARHRKSPRYVKTLMAWHCNGDHPEPRDNCFFKQRRLGRLRRDQPPEDE